MNVIFVILFSICFSFSAFSADKHFDTIVAFGDSLTDNGNLYRYMWSIVPSSPPYYEGHFTNGPVWLEHLYKSYFSNSNQQGLQDFAVGGAGAVFSASQVMPYTLTLELNNYLYWHTYGKKKTTLYSIWIGANNYLYAPKNVDTLTDSVTNSIVKVVERLIKKGGDKFLISNLPDLGATPSARITHTEAQLSLLTKVHNKKLVVKVERLKKKYPNIIFVYFDAYSFLNYVIDHANAFGLTNVSDACYSGGYRGLTALEQVDETDLYEYLKQKHPKMTEAEWRSIKTNPQLMEAVRTGYATQSYWGTSYIIPRDCHNNLFWDHIHPSTKMHSYIANQIRLLLDDVGLVPVSL